MSDYPEDLAYGDPPPATTPAMITFMTDSQKRQIWLDMCDEASADDFKREDFDRLACRAADEFSGMYGLPRFDQIADIDNAYLVLAEHEVPCDVCGERIKLGDERAEVCYKTEWQDPDARHLLVHEPCYNRDDMEMA